MANNAYSDGKRDGSGCGGRLTGCSFSRSGAGRSEVLELRFREGQGCVLRSSVRSSPHEPWRWNEYSAQESDLAAMNEMIERQWFPERCMSVPPLMGDPDKTLFGRLSFTYADRGTLYLDAGHLPWEAVEVYRARLLAVTETGRLLGSGSAAGGGSAFTDPFIDLSGLGSAPDFAAAATAWTGMKTQAAAPPQAAAPLSEGLWTCTCGMRNTGKFCEVCGTKRP